MEHFLRPQLHFLGEGYFMMRPWYVELFGERISIGKCVNVIASPERRVRMSVWPLRDGEGEITIGDYCLVCPGVRLGAAVGIHIGDNTMLASNVYVTDSDWHDIYNRIVPCQNPAAVRVENNAWIGDSAIVCKGVTIGENSIVGAGAVVAGDVPPNTIVAGNPAQVVKHLDPDERFTTREAWFADPEKLFKDIEYLDRQTLGNNSFRHWFRHLFFPAPGD